MQSCRAGARALRGAWWRHLLKVAQLSQKQLFFFDFVCSMDAIRAPHIIYRARARNRCALWWQVGQNPPATAGQRDACGCPHSTCNESEREPRAGGPARRLVLGCTYQGRSGQRERPSGALQYRWEARSGVRERAPATYGTAPRGTNGRPRSMDERLAILSIR